MISGTKVGLVSFTLGAVVELALFTTPCDFGLTLFYTFVADYADFIIRRRGLVENVLWVLLDRNVMHHVTIVT